MRGTIHIWAALLLALVAPTSCDKDRAASLPAPSAPNANAQSTAAAAMQTASVATRWSFDDVVKGSLPAGWISPTGRWEVTEGRTLRQVAQSPTRTFNVVLSDTPAKDLVLRARMRAVSGKIDQGGGFVWRATDVNNYYIMRYNPLEENFRVYVVKAGVRSQLASADVELPGDAWHMLETRMIGDRFEGSIDGRKYLEGRDSTFAESGAIGLWTKADAVTDFDDLELSVIAGKLDAKAIENTVGAKATTADDGVVRVSWPRTDVKVTVDQMPFDPAAGLGTWAAFASHGAGAMLMGDTVVFEDEATPAMDAAFAAGLEVTAIHNHFFFDQPKVYFMHIGGHGDPAELAHGVRNVWDAIRAVRRKSPDPSESFGGEAPAPGKLDAAGISKIVGHPAETTRGVVKITVGREGTMHGTRIGASMGLTTWAAFSGSDALAAIDGDFIMTEAEVQPVLRALRKAKLHVVALHNHMVGGEPLFYFTHFWGKAPAAELARGIRSVLDAQAATSVPRR